MWLRPCAGSNGIERELRDLLGHYMGDQLPFLGYDFETTVVSEILPTRTAKRPKVGGSGVLNVPGREVAWLKSASYAHI